jgi:hypothetical protein
MNQKDYPIQPVGFTKVRMTDDFWAPKIETNRTVTIPSILKRCEETGRIDNFAKAAKRKSGNYAGVWPFDDTDVYKLIEAAGFSLGLRPDSELERTLDDVIGLIAAAQEPDGYLFTWRTIDPVGVREWGGPERWSNIARSHEHYNAGHLFEAAVAYFQSTGKRTLLDAALKYADLLDHDFGPGKRRDVDGHPEVELGLVKLYRLTGRERYLRLAQFFIDERGRHEHRRDYGEYHVDAKPVLEMDEARGHVVRAAYLFSGMADVGALTGNSAYIAAIDRLWENVVFKKLYITGGMGAIGESGKAVGESFGDNYELPNLTAYNETCASIANAFWNHRMFLLHGEAKYLDVLERVAYNGIISGVSLNGDEFLYPNPLESDGKWAFNVGSPTRSQWFECACCTANIARFLPAFPGYIYAVKDDALYINLFAAGDADIEVLGQSVHLTQATRYPWDGTVTLTVGLDRPLEFEVHVRIPGWAHEQPVPSDLYRYLDESAEKIVLKVNGTPAAIDLAKSFARLRRTWKNGDKIELVLPMPIRRVIALEAVEEDAGKVALERGPIVYCAEGADNGGRVLDLALLDQAGLQAEFRPGFLGGVVVLSGKAVGSSGERDFLAIPYFAWANRGAGEMAVWLPRTRLKT